MKKLNALVLGLAALLAFGCSSDDPEPENKPGNGAAQTGCLPLRSKHEVVYGPEDREYRYNAAGQIEKITMAKNNKPTQLELISYSPTGRITWIRRYNLPAKELSGKSQYLYNADSLVSREVLYFPATPGDSTSLQPSS